MLKPFQLAWSRLTSREPHSMMEAVGENCQASQEGRKRNANNEECVIGLEASRIARVASKLSICKIEKAMMVRARLDWPKH